jgi:deoxyadenosine/deoxycytidine kinase
MSHWQPAVYLIDVQGNIGAGKSTTLAHVVPLLEAALVASSSEYVRPALVVAVQEPVEAYKDVRAGLDPALDVVRAVADADSSMLEAMYAGRPGAAALFQTMALTERVMATRRALAGALADARTRGRAVGTVFLVTERSPDADAHIFAKGLVESGAMSASEMCGYHRVYRDWRTLLPVHTHLLTVYLRAEPHVCFARVQARARDGESRVTLGLLERLHARHEALYHTKGGTSFGVPVYALDATTLGDVRVDDDARRACARRLATTIELAFALLDDEMPPLVRPDMYAGGPADNSVTGATTTNALDCAVPARQ